jgi:hypothetical protein
VLSDAELCQINEQGYGQGAITADEDAIDGP